MNFLRILEQILNYLNNSNGIRREIEKGHCSLGPTVARGPNGSPAHGRPRELALHDLQSMANAPIHRKLHGTHGRGGLHGEATAHRRRRAFATAGKAAAAEVASAESCKEVGR
jgi:hypothetical protein